MSATATGTRNSVQRAAYSPTVEALARLGYGVRGVLYILIGILALKLVIGSRGQSPSPQGALTTLAQQPAGKTLLWIMVIGLFGYALWSLIKALFNPLHRKASARFGYFVSAVAYSFLAWTAYGLIKGQAASSGTQTQMIAKVMGMTGGRLLVIVLGLIIFLVGLRFIIRAIRNTFERDIQMYALTNDERRIITTAGRYGTFARGVVFAIIGALIMWGGYTYNSGQSVGIDAALLWLLKQPFGTWLVVIVAVGLIAFGIYSLLCAAWFRLRRAA